MTFFIKNNIYRVFQNILKLGNVVVKIIKIFISAPIQLLKIITFQSFIVFIEALKNESPKQIASNLKKQLTVGNKTIYQKNNEFKNYSKSNFKKLKQNEFERFLKDDVILDFSSEKSKLSIILVLYNQAELSYACLKSIHEHCTIPVEIVIIDNNSEDKTTNLLSKISGAKIIRNNENLHFIKACNQAFEHIETEFVLFLNNDTEVFKNSIELALNTIENNKTIGAVGGKIILPSGKLQEAGSIVWDDASCYGYGRNDLPSKAEYNFSREVDYCSAAFLMTRYDLLKKHGGFDQSFEPAYYEETDYCFWLRGQGFKIIYEPQAIIRHFEFGSGNNKEIVQLQQNNQLVFYNKHKSALKKQHPTGEKDILHARSHASYTKKKVLYIDDRVPDKSIGSGFPRASKIIDHLKDLGYFITIYPLYHPFKDTKKHLYSDIEILYGYGKFALRELIKERSDYYNLIWISRPHNMKLLSKHSKRLSTKTQIIYDAEAIFIERDLGRNEMNGIPIKAAKKDKLYQTELNLCKAADKIVSVSEKNAAVFKHYTHSKVFSLGHSFKPLKSIIDFNNRKDLLFVGNLDDEASPNVDSIKWFIKEVFPIIHDYMPELKLNIIGSTKAFNVKHPNVKMLGQIQDLKPFYESHRVFIAPTRFAAGIPYKVHEAAAFGLPVVATTLLGNQLNWKHNKELILSDTKPKDFAKAIIELYKNEELWCQIQEKAYLKIENEHSEESFRNKIVEILSV